MKRAIKAALVDVGIVLVALLVAGLVVAWALRGARADHGTRVPTPEESMRGIHRCVVGVLTVDGLPIFRHGWCYWDSDRKTLEPMEKDLDRHGIINITPVEGE